MLTRDVNETIRARAEWDPAFRAALIEEAATDLFDACTQILAALDSDDAEELANGYESARLAVAKAKLS